MSNINGVVLEANQIVFEVEDDKKVFSLLHHLGFEHAESISDMHLCNQVNTKFCGENVTNWYSYYGSMVSGWNKHGDKEPKLAQFSRRSEIRSLGLSVSVHMKGMKDPLAEKSCKRKMLLPKQENKTKYTGYVIKISRTPEVLNRSSGIHEKDIESIFAFFVENQGVTGFSMRRR